MARAPLDVIEQRRVELPTGWLRCPRTRSALRRDGDRLVAAEGGHVYPVVQGIPDFRLFDPPYVTREEERRRVALLAEAAASRDFAGLVAFYETEVLKDQAPDRRAWHIEHRLSLPVRAKKRLHGLVEAARFSPPKVEAGAPVLDLGCGSGEALSELARVTGGSIVGIDISLEELFLARKLMEEEGTSALLVAGVAEALPFADGMFRFVYSPDVIEHVTSQPDYLREIHRVLAPGAPTLLNSPNRFSLLTLEPHVGIWGLGFLPRPLMDPVCRLLGKGPYVGKRLLSLSELRRILSSIFRQYTVSGRDSNPRATSLPGRLYHALRPVSVPLFAHVCDQHIVVAVKDR